MPDPNKEQYDPTDKKNRWPKAFYHPSLPMRNVADAEAAEALTKEDSDWSDTPYHKPDGTLIKSSDRRPATKSTEDKKDSGKEDKKDK